MSQKIVAFQGVLGAYSHMAAQATLPDYEVMPCGSFSEMMAQVRDGNAQMAMVPVENSTAGRVADIHHLLPESGLKIAREHFQPVNHQLFGIKGAALSDITHAHSHEQALAQCRNSLESHSIQAVTHADTAGAAQDIARTQDKTQAAIASRLAGEIYELELLAENFEDMVSNTTRFLLMAPDAPIAAYDPAKKYVTTMVFQLRSVPAALYKALGGFATNGVNMTKIESYMRGKHQSAAQFYVDLEEHIESPAMVHALEELAFYCEDDGLQILGSYPAADIRYKSS